MSIQNFIPQVWSARLNVLLDRSLVIAPRANTDWQGEIRGPGDRVRIQRPGNLTVTTYVRNVTNLTYQIPTSATTTLTIDRDEVIALQIDDADALQANIPLVDRFVERAAFSFADNIDRHVGSLFASAGIAPINIALGGANFDFWDTLVVAAQRLDDNNVPRHGRWLIVSPAGFARLVRSPRFIHPTQRGDDVIARRQVGQAAEFDVYISNNLSTVPGPPARRMYLYGTNDAMTHARQMVGTPEPVRLIDRIGDGIRMRILHGTAVVEPAALGVIAADET